MFITAEFYDKLCPSYKKLIKELDDCIVKLQSDTIEKEIPLQQKLIENFYSNYLMPKEYWNLYYERIGTSYEDFNNREQQIFKTAYKHFYLKKGFEPIPQENVYKHLKLLKFLGGQSDYMIIEADYLYPHSTVKGAFQSYEMNATSPPTKNVIQEYGKMEAHYQKIKASENNVKEWFENLLEVGDTEFVIHNVEYRLGGNLLDKKLWKLYIKFLENADTNKMLEVYSKYCRFFLDDFEMKEEYKAKVEKYGPIFVEWENLFDFEKKVSDVDEENSDDSINEKQIGSDYRTHTETMFQQSINKDENEIQIAPSIDKNLLKKFYQNYQNQIFPFQKPFIEYILENANAAVWRKLYQTCKYFYGKKNVPICYNLQIKDTNSFFNNELLTLNFNENENEFLKNTWITTTFLCNIYQTIPKNYISKILPRLYKCEAKYILIWKQKLTYNELKFLIRSGNVIDLNLSYTRIKDKNNKWISLQKIMKYTPNIEHLQLDNVRVTKNTANRLVNQKFNSKFNFIVLLDIFGEPFETMDFIDFIKKNKDENFILKMAFHPRRSEFSKDVITKFREVVQNSSNFKNAIIEINFAPL